jgi:hypothetical protein
MTKCLNCKEKFLSKYTSQKFCGRSCAAIYNNVKYPKRIKKIRFCRNCGIELVRKTQLKYCSLKCQNGYAHSNYIIKWKLGLESGTSGYGVSSYIKRYLFEKYNNKCSKCGWAEINPYTGNIPLEVEHSDGDWKNNKEKNLCLLCPNCHSLTKTYKGANKGRGRKARRKYYLPPASHSG